MTSVALVGVWFGLQLLSGSARSEQAPEPGGGPAAPLTSGEMRPVRLGGAARIEDSGAGCSGWRSARPDAVIELHEPADVALRLTSEADAVLLLVGEDGAVFCDDDSAGGRDALLSASLPAGRYRIWAGAWRRTDLGRPASLERLPAAAALPRSERTDSGFQGALHLPGAGKAWGRAGGPRDADAVFGRDCAGRLDSAPNHLLFVKRPTRLRLRVIGDAGHDTTLVVLGPSVLRCSDDAVGRDPALDLELEAGRYQVWVGAFRWGEDQLGYTILSDELEAP